MTARTPTEAEEQGRDFIINVERQSAGEAIQEMGRDGWALARRVNVKGNRVVLTFTKNV